MPWRGCAAESMCSRELHSQEWELRVCCLCIRKLPGACKRDWVQGVRQWELLSGRGLISSSMSCRASKQCFNGDEERGRLHRVRRRDILRDGVGGGVHVCTRDIQQ